MRPAGPPKAVRNDPRRLGVQAGKAGGAAVPLAVRSRAAILTPERDHTPLDRPEQAPVLFDLGGAGDLGRLGAEFPALTTAAGSCAGGRVSGLPPLRA